jgi:hypothetical protein
MPQLTPPTRALLVLGAPRSGTTLLAAMLGCHPDVVMLNEDLRFSVSKIIGNRAVGNKVPIPTHMELSRKLTLFTRFLYKTRLMGLCRRLGLFNSFFPGSFYSIEDYLVVDGIKLVGIVRNPNDVISSMMRREKWSFDFALRNWARSVEILASLHERLKQNMAVITFEDLVSQPEPVMRRLSDFLGLDYDPQMLEGCLFNPIYPESAIRPDRANRANRDGTDYAVAQRQPAAHRMYLDLVSNGENH